MFGQSARGLQRLAKQAALVEPETEDLFQRAGITAVDQPTMSAGAWPEMALSGQIGTQAELFDLNLGLTRIGCAALC